MGCGCGKKAKAPTGERWEVTAPTGDRTVFVTEHAARQEAQRVGGQVKHITS